MWSSLFLRSLHYNGEDRQYGNKLVKMVYRTDTQNTKKDSTPSITGYELLQNSWPGKPTSEAVTIDQKNKKTSPELGLG